MGIEQVFIDYFQRAKEADTSWKAQFNKKRKNSKWILVQTLAEIINKEPSSVATLIFSQKF
jgi:hypothetical protein